MKSSAFVCKGQEAPTTAAHKCGKCCFVLASPTAPEFCLYPCSSSAAAGLTTSDHFSFPRRQTHITGGAFCTYLKKDHKASAYDNQSLQLRVGCTEPLLHWFPQVPVTWHCPQRQQKAPNAVFSKGQWLLNKGHKHHSSCSGSRTWTQITLLHLYPLFTSKICPASRSLQFLSSYKLHSAVQQKVIFHLLSPPYTSLPTLSQLQHVSKLPQGVETLRNKFIPGKFMLTQDKHVASNFCYNLALVLRPAML